MKFSVKLIAAALCAAVLCVPALAVASATGTGAYVPNPQYTVISGTVAHQKDGGLLMSTSTGEPTEDYILWTEGVMILDAVSGEPVDAKSIKDGSTVYAWLGAQTAVAMSLPPQVTPELLLVNVPADYKVPQYDVIVRATVIMAGIPHYSGMDITLSDGTVYQVWEDAQITPYLTRNRVTYQDLLPGTRVLVWADDKGQASKIIVFPTSTREAFLWTATGGCMSAALPWWSPPPCVGPTEMNGCMYPSGRWRKPPGMTFPGIRSLA